MVRMAFIPYNNKCKGDTPQGIRGHIHHRWTLNKGDVDMKRNTVVELLEALEKHYTELSTAWMDSIELMGEEKRELYEKYSVEDRARAEAFRDCVWILTNEQYAKDMKKIFIDDKQEA